MICPFTVHILGHTLQKCLRNKAYSSLQKANKHHFLMVFKAIDARCLDLHACYVTLASLLYSHTKTEKSSCDNTKLNNCSLKYSVVNCHQILQYKMMMQNTNI